MRLLTVPVAVMSLAMLVGSCAKPAPVEELPPPPRITWQKTQVATDRVDLPARKRGLRAVRGIIHLHSVYSHDACDGNPQPLGQPSAPCLRNLRKGLCATRQDFAMLTDHATHMGEAPWDKLFLTDPAAGDQTIREGGELVGGRMRCPDEAEQPGSHEVVITVGGENDLMPVGLHRHLGDTVAAFKWLDANRPEVGPPVLVHGDFRLGNVIVGDDGLRAVIDWELAHLGDPMEDLGWLCVKAWRFGSSLPVAGVGEYRQLFEAYEAAGGGAVDPDVVRWWEVLGTLKWGVMCIMQANAHVAGLTRSHELAAIGRRVCENEHDLFLALEGRW